MILSSMEPIPQLSDIPETLCHALAGSPSRQAGSCPTHVWPLHWLEGGAPACPAPTRWERPQEPEHRLGQGCPGIPEVPLWSDSAWLLDGQTACSKSQTNNLVLVLTALWESAFGDSSGHLRWSGNGTA